MDIATDLAIRAVIAALYSSGAVDASQVKAIMSALKEAAGSAQAAGESDAAEKLVKLFKGVHVDTAVS